MKVFSNNLSISGSLSLLVRDSLTALENNAFFFLMH